MTNADEIRYMVSSGNARGIAQYINRLETDYAKLKAENNRLRKAGEFLVGEYSLSVVKNSWKLMGCWEVNTPAIEAWNAAKEGKPSA